MSDVVMFQGKKVAAAFRHLDPNQNLGDEIIAGFPAVNYRAKVWSLRWRGQSYNFVRDDDGTPLSYLDVIIVGVSPTLSKVYYPPGEWDEDSAGAPICASVKGDVPDPGVPEPQAKACGICKNNAWTTLPNGRRGKPCQDHKRLAVLLMPAQTAKMTGSPLTEPVFLKVPPGSLTTLKTYGDLLSHQGYPFASVVTRISFSTDKLFQMQFKGHQLLSDAEAPLVLPLLEDPRTKRMVGDQPEISEIDVGPEVEDKEEDKPVDTGIAAAFGVKGNGPIPAQKPAAQAAPAAQTPKRGRGRPPKNAAAAAMADAPPPPQESKAEVQGDQWDEGDTDLDREVADALGRKVDNMLK